MIDNNSGRRTKRFMVLSLLFLCSVLILPGTLTAQTPPSTAIIMVEIQCKPGMADQYREAFNKEILPAIREAIQKGDAFTNFTFFEAPLPAQETDFIMFFEVKSFASLDAWRIPPHYVVLLRRLGPERFESLAKEMGSMEKTVHVSMFRSYRVQ